MSISAPTRQRDQALTLLRRKGLARVSEFGRAGITAATLSRRESSGAVTRVARGLYQLADSPVDANHALAAAAKLVPKGVVCLTCALAFHELTDQIPARAWLAIGSRDWKPQLTYPRMRFAYFPDSLLRSGVTRHAIDGV